MANVIVLENFRYIRIIKDKIILKKFNKKFNKKFK